MKKLIFVFFLVAGACSIVFLIGSSSRAAGALQVEKAQQDYVPHELLVKFREGAVGDLGQNKWQVQGVLGQVQGKIRTYLNEEKDTFDWNPAVLSNRSFHADPYLFHIRVPDGIDLEYAIACLKVNPLVEYVEKNAITHIETYDPYFNQQWGLLNPTYSGRDIHAEDAWTIATGSPDVIVAVIDTGVDYNHDDLIGNLWTNPNETADGQDNDHNGFVDDLNGWNFVAGNANYLDDNTHKYVGACVLANVYHGTHVSGIIGAVANNDEGISGVCWEVKIMPLKAANYCGLLTLSDAINAIDYATANGAFLTSNSWGGFGTPYQSLEAAIGRAKSKNRLFIAAAGNSEKNVDSSGNADFPVCFTEGNIVGVLATAIDDTKPDFSNYGPTSVDVGAPGVDILSTKLGDAYQELGGTSMATPFVAGTAALALGVCPGLTYDRLKNLIISGADYVSNLNNKCVSDGRLNAYNVLHNIPGGPSPSAPSNLAAYAKAWDLIELRWNDNSTGEAGFEIQRKDQYQTAYLHHNCKDMNSTAYAYFQDPVYTAGQRTYTYRVRAANKAGISSFSNTVSASVPYTVPDAPTDLGGQSPTLEQNVNINWLNHANNGYLVSVERRIPGETDWEVIATLNYDDNSYSDNYALGGHTYEYRVRAGNPLGYSSYSNTIAIEVIEW